MYCREQVYLVNTFKSLTTRLNIANHKRIISILMKKNKMNDLSLTSVL